MILPFLSLEEPMSDRTAHPSPTLARPATGRRLLPAVPLLAYAAVLSLALAGCSGDSSAGSESTSPMTAAASEHAAGDPAGGEQGRTGAGSGTSGLIASLTGSVIQVQGTDSQTAVSFSDATTVTQTVAATVDDVTVGSCVVVMGGVADSTDADSTASAAATSVVVSGAVGGECTAGLGGGFGRSGDAGGRPAGDNAAGDDAAGEAGEQAAGRPTDLPSDMPTDMAGDMPGGGFPGGFGSFTAGMVTAVDGVSLTVETTTQDGTTSTSTVALADTTTYTATVDADTSAIAVGLCAQVSGEPDSSGTVAATSVALTEAGDSGCSTRGMGGQGVPGGGGAPSGTASSNAKN